MARSIPDPLALQPIREFGRVHEHLLVRPDPQHSLEAATVAMVGAVGGRIVVTIYGSSLAAE